MPEAHEREESRVLREVLRTPAFRELIAINTAPLDAEEGRRLIETILRENPELPLDLLSSAPSVVDAATASAMALGEQLAGMPRPLLFAYLDGLIAAVDEDRLEALPRVWGPIVLSALPALARVVCRAFAELANTLRAEESDVDAADQLANLDVLTTALQRLDGVELGRSVNAFSELIIDAERHAPDLAAQSALPRDFVETADFGKLRCATEALSRAATKAALGFLEPALEDPVVVSNLAVTLPPLLNKQLALAKDLLQRLDLPDELLASAVFAVIEDIDTGSVGALLSEVAGVVVTLHRGSLVLGGHEPAFRAVLADAVEDLLATLDGDALREALIAVGEDGETVAQVLSDVLRRDPTALPRWCDTGLAASAPILRGAVDLLREANRLPEASFNQLAQVLDDGVDAEELGALLIEVATFLRRLDEAGPKAGKKAGVLGQKMDHDAVRAALGAAFTSTRAFTVATGLGAELEPEAVAERINRTLRAVNQATDDEVERSRPTYLQRLMRAIDTSELERAWRHVLGDLTGTSNGDNRLTRAVIDPLLSVGWEAALTLIPVSSLRKLLLEKHRQRRERGA